VCVFAYVVAVCCSVCQCVTVCCRVCKCITVWCSVLQCAAVYCSVWQWVVSKHNICEKTRTPRQRSVCICKYAEVCGCVWLCVVVCCSVLSVWHGVAVYRSVLQRVAACCSILQCVAWVVSKHNARAHNKTRVMLSMRCNTRVMLSMHFNICRSVLQCVAVCCQCVAVCCNVLLSVAVRHSVLQCIAVCCSGVWHTFVVSPKAAQCVSLHFLPPYQSDIPHVEISHVTWCNAKCHRGRKT